MKKILLVVFWDLLVLRDLSALFTTRALQQVFNSIALVDLIELSTIVFNVLKVQPGVEKYTYDTNHCPEE